MTADVRLCGDTWQINYASEFDLRDGLARIAHLCGWDVETEHVVPGWGRPDLYLRAHGVCLAVELKLDLTTASRCRKAVQQSDTYLKAMPEVSWVFLSAPHINLELAAPYMDAYPGVDVRSISSLVHFLKGHLQTMDTRHRVALARFQESAADLEIHRRVLSDLANFKESPIGVHAAPGIEALA